MRRLHRCFFIGLCTCLCALLLLSPAPAHSQQWKSFRYATEGFSILMPAQPAVARRTVPTSSGSFELRTYIYESPAAVFFVGISDYAASPAAEPQAQLLGARNGILQNANAHLTSEKKIMLGIYPGLEFEAETAPEAAPGNKPPQPATHYTARLYLVGATLYQTMVLSASNSSHAPARRFLDSFQLIARTQE